MTDQSLSNIPDWLIEKWQDITDLISQLLEIPAVLIMKTENEYMEVFVSSHTENNPYHTGDREKWYGLYCETVIKTQKKLLVPNALIDKDWDQNPDIKLGMISYFGYPVNFPDNSPFGTLCVLDRKERHFTNRHDKLLAQFKNVIEFDLALIRSFSSSPEQLSKTIHDQQAQLVLSNVELRKTIEKAEESEKRFRSIIDNTHAGYFFINNEGIFEKVNQAWLDLYKYDSLEEVIGKHFTEVQIIDESGSAELFIEEIKKGNPNYSIGEYSRLCKDNSVGYHSFSANPVIIDNIPIGIEGFIFDITDRKLAENKLKLYAKELNDLNSDKDRFISILAHDLKSPFSALLGFSSLLKENIHTYDLDKIEFLELCDNRLK